MGDHSQNANSHTQATRPVGRSEVIQATVRAAAELFADKSPSQVAVREIAARAGVSHALVHRYLGSKENIFRHALAYNRDAMLRSHPHCHSGTAVLPFDCNAAQTRYVRTVVRAALDGLTFGPEELKPGTHDAWDMAIAQAKTTAPAADAKSPSFDARVVFSAVTAMTIGMAVAEEFCLIQSGLEEADHAWVCEEMSRLAQHTLSLGAVEGSAEPEACIT